MINVIMIFLLISVHAFIDAGSAIGKLSGTTAAQKNKHEKEAASACPCPTVHAAERKFLHETTRVLTAKEKPLIPIPDVIQIITSYLGLCTVWKQKKTFKAPIDRRAIIQLIALSPDRFIARDSFLPSQAALPIPNGINVYDCEKGHLNQLPTDHHVGAHMGRTIARVDQESVAILSDHCCSIDGVAGAQRSVALDGAQMNPAIGNKYYTALTLLPHNRLAVIDADGFIKVWNVSNGQMVSEIPIDSYKPNPQFRLLITMPNGDLLAGSPTSLSMVDPITKRTKWHWPSIGQSARVCILSGGDILCADQDYERVEYTVYRRKAETGTVLDNGSFMRTDKLKFKEYVISMLALAGNKAALGLSDGSIVILDPKKLTVETTLKGHANSVLEIFLHDANTLISTCGEGSLIVWDLAKKSIHQKFRDPWGGIVHSPKPPIRSLATLSEGRFVSGDDTGFIILWEQAPCVCVAPTTKNKS